jgi:hypothetical protein
MKALFMPVKVILFLSVALLFQSCLETDVPITTEGEPVPKNFLGIWYDATDYESSPAFKKKYVVTQGEDNTVYINKFSVDSENKWEGESYKGHFSKVNKVLFLNLQKLEKSEEEGDESGGKYNLYRITFEDDVAKLDAITDDVTETFESSKELYDFVAKNMGYSFFYEKDESVSIIRSEDAE